MIIGTITGGVGDGKQTTGKDKAWLEGTKMVQKSAITSFTTG